MQDDATTGPGGQFLSLPWHAAGLLSSSQGHRIDAALRHDGALARTFAAIRRERAAIIDLNESLGTPSPRVRMALFAAIDAERPTVETVGKLMS